MMRRQRTIGVLSVLLCALVLVSGCARTPTGTPVVTRREITFEIQFNAPINDGYYYFIAIDIAGGEPHPTPVFPSAATGERWVTGSVTHFVRYYQGQYLVYRVKNPDTFETETLGAPLRADRLDPSTLRFTLDLNLLGASGESIDINVIATDQLLSPTRVLDALGPYGTQFLEIGITSDHPVTNQGIEPTGDVLDQNQNAQPSDDYTNPLDIKDFRIEVDV